MVPPMKPTTPARSGLWMPWLHGGTDARRARRGKGSGCHVDAKTRSGSGCRQAHLPSGFPYFRAIEQYWSTSFTVEYALKGAYENTVGRLTEWIGGHAPTGEDRYAARVAHDYGAFVQDRPFYEFPFFSFPLFAGSGRRRSCGARMWCASGKEKRGSRSTTESREYIAA